MTREVHVPDYLPSRFRDEDILNAAMSVKRRFRRSARRHDLEIDWPSDGIELGELARVGHRGRADTPLELPNLFVHIHSPCRSIRCVPATRGRLALQSRLHPSRLEAEPTPLMLSVCGGASA